MGLGGKARPRSSPLTLPVSRCSRARLWVPDWTTSSCQGREAAMMRCRFRTATTMEAALRPQTLAPPRARARSSTGQARAGGPQRGHARVRACATGPRWQGSRKASAKILKMPMWRDCVPCFRRPFGMMGSASTSSRFGSIGSSGRRCPQRDLGTSSPRPPPPPPARQPGQPELQRQRRQQRPQAAEGPGRRRPARSGRLGTRAHQVTLPEIGGSRGSSGCRCEALQSHLQPGEKS
mmetsp:Transcript_83447/g.221387  ORF Transcript_83447/g.221387 Transcript_83447/m.221387 type:complete len:236 (-) Transcript_83447:107-814(-)